MANLLFQFRLSSPKKIVFMLKRTYWKYNCFFWE